jgi:hypothetical protein
MDERRLEPLTDAALDREIEAALAVEPSPEFLARVRLSLAAEPARPSWRRWAFVGAAAAAAAAVLVIATWRVPVARAPRASVASGAAARGADAVVRHSSRPAEPARVAAARPRPPRAAPAPRAVEARPTLEEAGVPALPEVLFSETERQALAMLLTGVQHGEIPPMTRPGAAGVEGPDDSLPIEIDPLLITPLRIARLEGERP